jgi:predicted nucleic acid-binding protein
LIFVVDASYAAAWCFVDEATERTEVFLRLARETGVIVPGIWIYEIANLLRTAERRERISREHADNSLEILDDMMILDDEVDRSFIGSAVVALARQHNLTIYDASYVELGKRLGAPLPTRDRQIIAAIEKEGVALIEA